MREKMIPMIASKPIQSHQFLKRGWIRDAKSWINNQRIKEEFTLYNNDNIKILLHLNLRRKCVVIKNQRIMQKIKMYYKDVINHILKDKK